MRRRGRKIVVMAVLACMLFGCAGSGGKGEPGPDARETAEGRRREITFPLNEQTTITAMVRDFNRDRTREIDRILEEKTNIRIEWTIVSPAEYAAVFEQKFHSGELPDLFETWKEAADRFCDEGEFVDFSGYLDQMPHLRAWMEKIPAIYNDTADGEGRLYCLTTFNTRGQAPKQSIYRKDLFEKEGIKAPENLEELYDALVKLKEKYPDSIPVGNRWGLENLLAAVAGLYHTRTGFYLDNEEQVNFNRNWKFIRNDVEGAEAVSYDDSSWVDVGIPHNFSIPYEMAAQFYVGYGWYRKAFEVPEDWKNKKIELEFEGVFQVAEVYVNGQKAGTHEGGYSGFVYDITDYLHTGTNLVAVRVNNIWQHDLAPRAGDHQFTGGIYRDVYLNVTEDVHVAWYGTYVTTPDLTNPGFDESAANIDFTQFPSEEEIRANLSAKRSNVRVQTEVENDSDEEKEVQVFHKVTDADGKTVAEFASETATVAAGETAVLDAVSRQISGIELWSPQRPYLYKVYTTVTSGGVQTDVYESSFGFRWAQYKNDGFYLNGEKVLLDGANAHQDHAGFADAVTDEGLYRDAAMIKECGMNFIRGSHYPHDPSYAKACDELGILFWSECNFWGMGGSAGKDADAAMSASDWFKDAYPQNPEDEAAFENSCLESLEAMIRVNRNHPSIINWSMGNEVFFTASGTQNKAKALVNKMRNRAHELDPTRKAGMGGCQREGYDSLEICDIAGYNGDGGKFENNWMPNVVAEYGSKVQDRPGSTALIMTRFREVPWKNIP